MKNFWFYLEPYTFLWRKQGKVMLYNTLSGKHIIFEIESITKPIVESWDNTDNMYGVKLTEADMAKPPIQNLISQVRDTFLGDIIEDGLVQNRPVSLKPFLNFQMDRQRLENLKLGNTNKQYGDKILHHLLEMSIYVDGKCLNNCPYCSEYYKQTLCCTKNSKGFLQPLQIEKMLRLISYSSVKCINILGGDLLSNSLLLEYINILNQFGFTKNYYSHYLSINEHVCLMKSYNSTLHIIITFPIDEVKFEQAYKLSDIENLHVFWKFLVSSELEYSQANTLIEKLNIKKSKIIPFYTGSNYDFFSENIFTTLEDIDLIQLNRREIFANQYVNAFDFGKITLMPDGKIYANINHNALGDINDDIRELIYSELVNGKSWLRIRDQAPCVDCIYQWLCPSPSNYEIAIGRHNLCNVKLPQNKNLDYDN